MYLVTTYGLHLMVFKCSFKNMEFSAITVIKEINESLCDRNDQSEDKVNEDDKSIRQEQHAKNGERAGRKRSLKKRFYGRNKRRGKKERTVARTLHKRRSQGSNEKIVKCTPKRAKELKIEAVKTYGSNITVIGSIFNKTDVAGHSGSAIFAKHVNFLQIQSTLFLATKSNRSGGALFIEDSNDLLIESSTFIRTNSHKGGAIFINSTMLTRIKNCTFARCRAGNKGGAIEALSGDLLSVDTTLFLGNSGLNGGALHIFLMKSMNITNCLFKRNEVRRDQHRHLMRGCHFRGGGAVKIIDARLSISACVFLDNIASGKGGGIYFRCLQRQRKGERGKPCSFQLETSMIQHNQAAVDGGGIHVEKVHTRLAIMSCHFNRNNADSAGGAASGLDILEDIMRMQDCRFDYNRGIIGGALSLVRRNQLKYWEKQGQIIIASCEFNQNTASSLGQAIYSNIHSRMINLTVRGFDEHSHVYHIQAVTGNLYVKNVSFELSRNQPSPETRTNGLLFQSNHINIAGDVKLSCPYNFNPETDNSSYLWSACSGTRKVVGVIQKHKLLTAYTYFRLGCLACPYNTYSLLNGKIFFRDMEKQPEIERQKCEKFPVGGNCDKPSVKSVDNFWGHRRSPVELEFMLCPLGYCCSAGTNLCVDYQTCAEGRKGTLCGSCMDGYKLSFLRDQCVPIDDECRTDMFAVYLISFCVVYTTAFILITNMKDFIERLKRVIRSTSDDRLGEDGDVEESSVVEERQSAGKTLSISGYVQIIVLYFQIASLLRVKLQLKADVSEDEMSRTNGKAAQSKSDEIREIFSLFFNFRLTMVQNICPSDTLTLPEKEMMLLGMKMCTLLLLVVLYLLYQACNNLIVTVSSRVDTDIPRYRARRSRRGSSIIELIEREVMVRISDGQRGSTSCIKNEKTTPILTFGHRLKCTFIKLMKIYYTPICKSALHLIHCVQLQGTYHLYVSGDHVCYAVWQYAIIIILIPGLLLFPVCFEMSICLLKGNQISSTQFILSTFCPYYALFLHYTRKTGCENPFRGEEAMVRAISQSEEELFAQKEGCLGWTIIQFYRSFVLTFVSTFVTNPVYRQVILIPILLSFSIHDRYRMPYKNAYLNHVNVLASVCLVVVCACNVVPAMSYIVDITTTPGIFVVMKMSMVVEMALYALVPLTLPVWKIWSAVDERRKKR